MLHAWIRVQIILLIPYIKNSVCHTPGKHA